MYPLRRSIPFLALLAMAAACTAVAFASSPLPRILSCGGKPLLRPGGLVVLSCADAGSELRSTHWLSWTATSATGTTDFGLNLCTPTCVQSSMTFFPNSHVHLTGVVKTTLGPLFSRAVITYTLHGKKQTFVAYPPTRPL